MKLELSLREPQRLTGLAAASGVTGQMQDGITKPRICVPPPDASEKARNPDLRSCAWTPISATGPRTRRSNDLDVAMNIPQPLSQGDYMAAGSLLRSQAHEFAVLRVDAKPEAPATDSFPGLP